MRYVKDPLTVNPPTPPYVVGVSTSLVSRAELLVAWQPESPILQAGSTHIVDLLHDSDGLIDDEPSDVDDGA